MSYVKWRGVPSFPKAAFGRRDSMPSEAINPFPEKQRYLKEKKEHGRSVRTAIKGMCHIYF